eukprot:1008182-Amphidinium_carterae.2
MSCQMFLQAQADPCGLVDTKDKDLILSACGQTSSQNVNIQLGGGKVQSLGQICHVSPSESILYIE